MRKIGHLLGLSLWLMATSVVATRPSVAATSRLVETTALRAEINPSIETKAFGSGLEAARAGR